VTKKSRVYEGSSFLAVGDGTDVAVEVRRRRDIARYDDCGRLDL